MNNAFFLSYALSIGAYNKIEYNNLTSEEKSYLDFMDSCLYSENEKINNASFYTMLLLLKISNNIDGYTDEEVMKERNIILEGLTLEEREIMDKFTISCINSMGIYSEESKKERKFKKRED